jgi:uncharacterized protein (DUF952 family)
VQGGLGGGGVAGRQSLLDLAYIGAHLRTARAVHRRAALDLADGYVHFSTAAQVRETARRYYSGETRVRLLRFDLAALGDIRWEPSRGGDLFPHLYGPLEISKVGAAWWLMPGPDGAPQFPEDV